MDKLSQELVDRIASYLQRYEEYDPRPLIEQESSEPSKLPPYATLSRSWKEAIETVTFHSLRIKSDELTHLPKMVTGNRRKYVSKLHYSVSLPEYSEDCWGREETDEEKQLNNDVFTQGIRDLFSVIKAWENAGVQTTLRLELGDAFSPTDQRLKEWENQADIGMAHELRRRGLFKFEPRFENSLLEYHPDGMLTLSNVRRLAIDGRYRMVAPTTGPRLAASLPALEDIRWEFSDSGERVSVRSGNRLAFAESMKSLSLQKRSTAKILFGRDLPLDQRNTGPNLIPPGSSFDSFSAALRAFSQNLTVLTLDALLDSTVFWPSGDDKNAVVPTWPALKTFDITFNMVAPSGEWYFTGPRPADHPDDDPIRGIIGDDRDDTDSNYTNYREHGDPETLSPFLSSLAKAVQKMPVLEHFMLTSQLGDDKGIFQISYHGPGRSAEWGDENEDDLRVRRVYYEVGRVWRPDPEISHGLRDAGKEKYGGEVIERYLKSQYTYESDFECGLAVYD